MLSSLLLPENATTHGLTLALVLNWYAALTVILLLRLLLITSVAMIGVTIKAVVSNPEPNPIQKDLFFKIFCLLDLETASVVLVVLIDFLLLEAFLGILPPQKQSLTLTTIIVTRFLSSKN